MRMMMLHKNGSIMHKLGYMFPSFSPSTLENNQKIDLLNFYFIIKIQIKMHSLKNAI